MNTVAFLRRLPLSIKSGLLAGGLSVIFAVSQIWLLRWAERADTGGAYLSVLTPRVVLAIGGPLLVASVVSGLYAGWLVRYRGRAFLTGLMGIARGDLETELAPAPDAELRATCEAFQAMGASLRELTSRLRHADAQRRRLFADLAHELSTPVSTILGITEALERPELSSTEEARARLTRALGEEAARLTRLIEDVRDLAQLDDPEVSLELRPADVGEIAAHAAERLTLAADGRALTTIDVEPARALVDPLRIDQALVNLLANAQRHTPAQGVIELRVRRVEGHVHITIEDSGEGVPSSLRGQLGERLFRADASRDRRTGGHGLGLAIVSAIIEQHRGSLRFERASLGGLRVLVELPALDSPPRPPPTPCAPRRGRGAAIGEGETRRM